MWERKDAAGTHGNGIQNRRNTGQRDAEQEEHRAKGCRTGGTQGKGMKNRKNTGQWMQDRRNTE